MFRSKTATIVSSSTRVGIDSNTSMSRMPMMSAVPA
jgi:hypothetical protein